MQAKVHRLFQTNRQPAPNLVYWPLPKTKNNVAKMTRIDGTALAGEKWKRLLSAVAKERDRSAFQALYLHFSPKIKSFYFNQGMAAHAEELTHEVFIKVWKRAASYQPEKANVSTWIFTIVRNLRIDYLRKKRLDLVSDDESPEATESTEYDLDIDIARSNKQLHEVLQQMNDEQRNVLQKVYFEDKSHQQAADELEMTPGVVKSRIRSALKLLRSHLGGE